MEDLKLEFEERFGEYYVPENAEDESDRYNFEQFCEEVADVWNLWDDEIKQIMNLDKLTEFVVRQIDWTYPCTMVNEIEEDIIEEIDNE